MRKVFTKDLFLWIKDIQKKERDRDSLYLFLDLVGGISRSELSLLQINPKDKIELKEDLDILKAKWLQHSEDNIPIQYICKNSYWRNFKFELSNQVLIPRVETEQLVEIAFDVANVKEKILFADLGTGSGAIAIGLSAANHNWTGLVTDIDMNVLNIAKRNYQNISNYSNLHFFCGSWWDPLKNYAGKIDLVISNPPYIPIDVYKKLPSSVRDFEPMIALCGGEDGLLHIREIIERAPRFLRKGGWIILENHFDQSKKIKKLLQENGFNSVKTINDVFGIGRFTIGKYK